MTDYWFELATTDGDELSDEDREEILKSVAEEAGLPSEEYEVGPPARRLSADPALWISIGSLAVGSASLILDLYRATKDRDDVAVRSMNVSGGPMIFAENLDLSFVKSYGCTVVGEVEDEVIFISDPDDQMEFIKAIHEKQAEEEERE